MNSTSLFACLPEAKSHEIPSNPMKSHQIPWNPIKPPLNHHKPPLNPLDPLNFQDIEPTTLRQRRARGLR